ncbi:4Fe-4S binding protein [Streptosporangium roseum]|uniref:4Fe-4S binding protein n=1 Tax=Streptosporangium roseum TaxID=2001 RepID=UPI0002EA9FE1|nr:4Fe-4S binding protein [Streptosporangium roseum]
MIALVEENCTVCMLCARECPDWCIYIDSHKETLPAPEGGRPRARNMLDRFAIDFSLCMYCGICIEVCPFDALFWSPEFEYAEGDIRNLVHEKDKLAAWAQTVPPPPAHEPNADPPKELAAASRPVRPGPGGRAPGAAGPGMTRPAPTADEAASDTAPAAGQTGPGAVSAGQVGPSAGRPAPRAGETGSGASAGEVRSGTASAAGETAPGAAPAAGGTHTGAARPASAAGQAGPGADRTVPGAGATDPGADRTVPGATGPRPESGAPADSSSGPAGTAPEPAATPSAPDVSTPTTGTAGRTTGRSGPPRPPRTASAGHASVRAIRPPGALPKKDAPSTGKPSAEKLSTDEGGAPPAAGRPEQTSSTDPSGESEEET